MKIKNTEQKYIKNDFDNLPSSIENEDEHVVDVESEIGEKITKTLEVNTSHPMVEFQPALPDYDEYSPFTKAEHDRLAKLIAETEAEDCQRETRLVDDIEELQGQYFYNMKLGNPFEAEMLRKELELQMAKVNRECTRMYDTSAFKTASSPFGVISAADSTYTTYTTL